MDADCTLDQTCHHEGRFCERRDEILFGALLPDDNVSAVVGRARMATLEVVAATVNEAGGVRVDVAW